MTELEPAARFTIKEPATQESYIKGGESKVLTFENRSRPLRILCK